MLLNAICADGNYTREHLIRAMCALLGLVVPLHLFGRTYQRMSIGNIPTFEKIEEIANQTRQGMSALEWLQGFNDKIRSADELALVICGIKQIWGWANRKNRKKNINLEMFPSKVHLVMLYSAKHCHVFSSQKQRQVRRELGKAPFSKQAIKILRPNYKKNIEENKKVRWPGKIHASDQDKYLAMRALQTGRARITTLTHNTSNTQIKSHLQTWSQPNCHLPKTQLTS